MSNTDHITEGWAKKHFLNCVYQTSLSTSVKINVTIMYFLLHMWNYGGPQILNRLAAQETIGDKWVTPKH